ncbi:MAG: MFS transporter, partial [Acidobacteriales bacterium]|nr:MFS transporter [Terriglobales bacterium]
AIQLPPAPLPMPRVVKALQHRDFRLFWLGNFLSNIGTWMQNVAQGWLVLQLADPAPRSTVPMGGHSGAFWLGVVGFAASAPMLIFTLIGGVIADRVDRRRLMIRTQTAMMLSAFAMAALTFFRVINLPEIVLLAFITGVAMSLNTPSYQAMVPQLVPKEDLTNAIALNSAQFNLSRMIGPTIGGFFMAWLSPAANFLLNGISFLAVILVLRRIHYPPAEADAETASMWEHLADGFRYVLERRAMATLLALVGLASTFGIPYIMFVPYFARDILLVDERGLGILMAFSGAGAFLGAATIAYLGKIKRRGKFVVSAGSLFLLAVIAFTFSRNFALSAGLLMVTGFSMILMVATVNSLMQHLASDEMRGRVMSMYSTAFLGFAPVGSLIAGSLAGVISAPYAIAGMSALALVGSWMLYFTQPELRRLD